MRLCSVCIVLLAKEVHSTLHTHPIFFTYLDKDRCIGFASQCIGGGVKMHDKQLRVPLYLQDRHFDIIFLVILTDNGSFCLCIQCLMIS